MLENMLKYTFSIKREIEVINVSSLDDLESGATVFVDRIENCCFAEWDIEDIAKYFSDECKATQIFFMNTNKDYLFHKYNDVTVWNNVVPIIIDKCNKNTSRDTYIYNDFETETFYLLTQNKELRKMAIDFNEKMDLDNMQMEVRTNGFETAEQLKISVLEGILDATEQRLLHYIDKCNNLEEELNKLRK